MDDDKLVAADTRNHVVAMLAAVQSVRHLPQQFVAGAMSEHVVDGLEPVEIDRQHRERLRALARPAERLFDALPQQHPITQPGQRIMERHMANALILAMELRDIGEDDNVALNLPALIAYGGDGFQRQKDFAI